jgi:hypothetical protein
MRRLSDDPPDGHQERRPAKASRIEKALVAVCLSCAIGRHSPRQARYLLGSGARELDLPHTSGVSARSHNAPSAPVTLVWRDA